MAQIWSLSEHVQELFKNGFQKLAGAIKVTHLSMWPGWRLALPPVCCYFWLFNMKTVLIIFIRIKTVFTGFPCILIDPTVLHIHRGTCFPAGKQLPLDFPQLEKVASIYSAQGGQITDTG